MAWTVLNPFVAYQRVQSATMEAVRQNQNHLKDLPYQANRITKASNITTSSLSWVVVDSPLFVLNVTPTISSGVCTLDIWGNFNLRCSSTATFQIVRFRIDIDGISTTIAGAPNITVRGNSDIVHPVSFYYRRPTIAPGNHTINLAWYVNGGTATIFSNTADAYYAEGQFGAKESS